MMFISSVTKVFIAISCVSKLFSVLVITPILSCCHPQVAGRAPGECGGGALQGGQGAHRPNDLRLPPPQVGLTISNKAAIK